MITNPINLEGSVNEENRDQIWVIQKNRFYNKIEFLKTQNFMFNETVLISLKLGMRLV